MTLQGQNALSYNRALFLTPYIGIAYFCIRYFCPFIPFTVFSCIFQFQSQEYLYYMPPFATKSSSSSTQTVSPSTASHTTSELSSSPTMVEQHFVRIFGIRSQKTLQTQIQTEAITQCARICMNTPCAIFAYNLSMKTCKIFREDIGGVSVVCDDTVACHE